jgi:uncharacterized protein YdaU (DUF1376 family)
MSAPFMQLYVADYLGDTRHLTTEQHGAYLLLLMTMWRHGGRLPNDPAKLARIAGVSARRWHLVASDVMPFFTVCDDGTITQKRLEREHQKALSISEKRSVSGKRGGQAKALNNNDLALANAKQEPKHSQISDVIKEAKGEDANASLSGTDVPDAAPKSRKKLPYPEAFEALWKAYPTDPLMSKKAACASWKKLTVEQRELALASCPAFREYCRKHPDYRPVHLTKYLKEERFLGFRPAEARVNGQVFVERGTSEWDAWQRVRFTPAITAEGGKVGWWFPTQSPTPEEAAT